jgi:hypothetical protein
VSGQLDVPAGSVVEDGPRIWKVSKSSLNQQMSGKRANAKCQFHQHFMPGFFVRKFFSFEAFCTDILGLNFFLCKNIGANAFIKCW